MRPRVFLAVVVTVLQFVWVAAMMAASVFKLVEFGCRDYFQHYTNWMWTMLMLFYLATLPAPLIVATGVTDWRLTLMSRFIAVTFIPLWGIVTSVLYLVIFMLLSGSEMLEVLAQVYPISIIVVGNEASHFFTHLSLFIWTLIMQALVYYSYNELFADVAVHRKRKYFWGLFAYLVYIGPTITYLLYSAVFDPHVVYQTTVNTFLGVLVEFALLSLASGLPLACFVYFLWLGFEPLDPRWISESRFKSMDDRVTVPYGKFKFAKNKK